MTELPDRLLRETLREGTPATAPNACVDAEALAAWADGTMSRAAHAAFESHAADCARCQALMAAMLRSEPAPEIRAAWWRRSPVSWLMPLAAAAAGIVIVVDLAMTERRAPVSQMARQEAPASPMAARPEPLVQPAPSTPVTHAAPPPAGGAAHQGAEPRREAIAPPRKSPPPAAAPRPDAAAAQAAASEPRAKAVAEPAQPAPAPAPAAPPVQAQAASPALPLTAAKDMAAPSAAAGAPARDEASKPESMAYRAAAPALARAASSSLRTVIASPDHDWQWRIAGGAVEQTRDGGKTWQPQALGETATIRAGAAPAARVCWLVGARGVVLLTTDATTWRRLAFPEAVDLVAVQADDAARATVTTAAGRRYGTADGGLTWTAVQ